MNFAHGSPARSQRWGLRSPLGGNAFAIELAPHVPQERRYGSLDVIADERSRYVLKPYHTSQNAERVGARSLP